MQLLVTPDLTFRLVRVRSIPSPLTDHRNTPPIHLAMTEAEALNIADLLTEAAKALRTANEQPKSQDDSPEAKKD